MISEIEYSVEKYNDRVVDEERFLLRMIDGNTIYVNLVNIEKLNKYQEIYAWKDVCIREERRKWEK